MLKKLIHSIFFSVPLPPQNFRVSETTTTEISLEWEDVLGMFWLFFQ